MGWHVDPLAIELVQSPAPPFVGAVDVSHLVSHVPKLVQTPVCDVPEQPNTVAPVVEQSGSCAPQPQSHPSSASKKLPAHVHELGTYTHEPLLK